MSEHHEPFSSAAADQLPQPERLSRLQELYGREIELTGPSGESERYRIAAEYRAGQEVFAALQTEQMRKEGEALYFLVLEERSGVLQLESISDEDMWERAAEAYDDLFFNEQARA